MNTAIATATHEQHRPPSGIMRWLSTTNHKDLGILYMSFGAVMFFIGGAFVMAVRAELLFPGMQWMSPGMYNQLFTLHALIMVFGAIMPFATGLNNYLIPLMIGAPDMALPRVNNWGFCAWSGRRRWARPSTSATPAASSPSTTSPARWCA